MCSFHLFSTELSEAKYQVVGNKCRVTIVFQTDK